MGYTPSIEAGDGEGGAAGEVVAGNDVGRSWLADEVSLREPVPERTVSGATALSGDC